MGVGFAPTYANLFLGLWEKDFIYHNNYSEKIKWWGRYIDETLVLDWF